MFGCYEVVNLLWERGARPTICREDNTTLLHSAVLTQDDSQDEERARILRFFLTSDECRSNCLPLNHQNCQGWTALKLASRKNLEKCVEILVDRDADPDIPCHEHFTALHNAVGNPEILKMLSMKSKNIDAYNKAGETPLYLAAERGLVESALILLEYGANPNVPNKEGKTTCIHVPQFTSPCMCMYINCVCTCSTLHMYMYYIKSIMYMYNIILFADIP